MNPRTSILLAAAAALALAAFVGADDELVWKNGKWVRVARPEEGTAAGELAIVRRDVDERSYKAAVKHAKRFLKRYPGHVLSEDVLNLAGDAELARGRYWSAYKWYERQLTSYPDGALADRATEREIEIAEAFLAGKKRRVGKVFRISGVDDGLEILEKIAERAPRSDRAQLALLAIADHYLNREKWTAAAESYDQFLKLFPKSPRAAHAELRAAEAYHSAYRGPNWDETPLIEAEQRYKTFLTHFPRQARERDVGEILRQIRSDRAAKQYHVARFYIRTKHPKAAAEYLKLIVKEYPGTEWVDQALDDLSLIDPEAADALAPPTPASAPAPTRDDTLPRPRPDTQPADATAPPNPKNRKEAR